MSQSVSTEGLTERSLNVVGKMSLNDALVLVQDALIRIRASLNHTYTDLPVVLDSADLNLETMLGADVGIEAKVAVVTVTGKAAAKATSTLAVTMREFQEIKDHGIDIESFDPVTHLVDLADGMFEALQDAMKPGGMRLELKTGSIKMVLVVSAEGDLKIAPAGWWEELLKGLGLGFSASAGAEWVSTSTITLNFKNKNDEETEG